MIITTERAMLAGRQMPMKVWTLACPSRLTHLCNSCAWWGLQVMMLPPLSLVIPWETVGAQATARIGASCWATLALAASFAVLADPAAW